MMPVREMAAVRQVQSENGVARLQNGRVGFHVGLRSGMGLHVGVLRAEQLLGAVARQVLDDVGKLAAAVVALARISLGVLIGEHRARGFEHGFADEVFRGDQLQALRAGGGLRYRWQRRSADRLRRGARTFLLKLNLHIIVRILVNIGLMQFHVSLWRLQRCKSKLRVQTVRIARQQNPAPQILQRGMLHDAFHHPLAQPASAMRSPARTHPPTISEGRKVAESHGQSQLALPLHHKCRSTGNARLTRDNFPRNPLRPIAIRQETCESRPDRDGARSVLIRNSPSRYSTIASASCADCWHLSACGPYRRRLTKGTGNSKYALNRRAICKS